MAVNAVKVTDRVSGIAGMNAKLKEALASVWVLEGHDGFWSYQVGAKPDTTPPSGAVLGIVGGGMVALFVENQVFNHLVEIGSGA